MRWSDWRAISRQRRENFSFHPNHKFWQIPRVLSRYESLANDSIAAVDSDPNFSERFGWVLICQVFKINRKNCLPKTVSLSWKLHFEFVTTKVEDVRPTVSGDSQGVMCQSSPELSVQTMVWDLPIVVYATHPVQVARGFQIPATSTLTV